MNAAPVNVRPLGRLDQTVRAWDAVSRRHDDGQASNREGDGVRHDPGHVGHATP
jgi:hypothetical protein